MHRAFAAAVSLMAAQGVLALPVTWNEAELFRMPEVYSAVDYVPGGETNGVKAIFLEGLPFKGRPTRDFAYWGVPKTSHGAKVPAMVLVHGGGGSAFHRWVKFWNDRGYAAISMDLCGSVSGNVYGREQTGHKPHPWMGPGGSCGGFALMKEKPEDQWMYHAVGAVARAHTFIRTRPRVDAARTGLTGVSWGGIVNCVVAAVDGRFKFAVPVYGCGFLYTDSASWWHRDGAKKGVRGRRDIWSPLWDPMNYLAEAKIPVHWLNGTNDQNFSLPSLTRSYALVPKAKSLSVRVRMGHGHGAVSEQAKEVIALADHYLRGAPALPAVSSVAVKDGMATATYQADSRSPVVKGTLDYTCDNSAWWYSNRWETVAAEIKDGRVQATVPTGARHYYLNVETADGLRASTGLASVPVP